MSFQPVHRHKHINRVRFIKLLSSLSTFVLFSIVAGIIGVVGIIIFFLTQIPSPEQLQSRAVPQSTKIYDRNGELLYDIFTQQNRTPIKFEDVPLVVRQATIAIEDKDFYKHKGFSLTGVVRGVFVQSLKKGRAEGGSTLTQQLVKNALLNSERSLVRLKGLILKTKSWRCI